MTDIINRQLSKAVSRHKTSPVFLQRFFSVHYNIRLSLEVLEKRLSEIR
jgi:hypothetical protein